MYVKVQVLHGCVDTNLATNGCKYNVALNEAETLKLTKKTLFVRIYNLPLVISNQSTLQTVINGFNVEAERT